MKKCTLLFLYKPQEKQILLAMKKRGFGAGKWNGVGGKVLEDESIESAVLRETKEEIGVSVKKGDLRKVAVIDFSFKDKPEFTQQVHTFFVEQWEGEPIESEEMKPGWYTTDRIPYESMWVDDKYWLPEVLKGKRLTCSFHFDTKGEKIINMEIKEQK